MSTAADVGTTMLLRTPVALLSGMATTGPEYTIGNGPAVLPGVPVVSVKS